MLEYTELNWSMESAPAIALTVTTVVNPVRPIFGLGPGRTVLDVRLELRDSLLSCTGLTCSSFFYLTAIIAIVSQFFYRASLSNRLFPWDGSLANRCTDFIPWLLAMWG
jgi:hypothetical protein